MVGVKPKGLAICCCFALDLQRRMKRENPSENPSLPILPLQNVGTGGRPSDEVLVEMDHEGLSEVDPVQGQIRSAIESCGVSQPGLSSSIAALDGVDNPEEAQPSEPSEKEPYGPWMQASSRRRKPVSHSVSLGSSGNRGRQPPVNSGSRFASLVEDSGVINIPSTMSMDARESVVMNGDGRHSVPAVGQTSRLDIGGPTVLKNAAYKASNPEKRSKSSKFSSGTARVVSLVNEKEPVVATQGKTFGNEHHKTTTIVEQPIQLSAAIGGKIIKERGNVVRSRNDGIHLDRPGIRVQKLYTSSHMQPALYEWMQEFAKELESGGKVADGTFGVDDGFIATNKDTRHIANHGNSVTDNAVAVMQAGGWRLG
ncbi:hypothetical protein V6N13_072907 [Hibiscus sabdariffa]|uniref:Uncharacterized protein n=1 Tax=Hibiscus sabdariffa TaxID=183260 RepID=A0ABR2E815_9ROSI